jgi:DeoR/GlpR family transcriptional regulator of sugar metabolism
LREDGLGAYCSVDEVAALLGVHPQTVRRRLENGSLLGEDHREPGALRPIWRIRPAAIELYLQERSRAHTQEPPTPAG